MAINWKSWDTVGGVMSIGGTVTGLIGNWAESNRQKYEAKSAALNLEHQEDMAAINADMLEMEAQQVFRAYNRQIMTKTMAAGLKEGKAKTSFAARGIALGYGRRYNVNRWYCNRSYWQYCSVKQTKIRSRKCRFNS